MVHGLRQCSGWESRRRRIDPTGPATVSGSPGLVTMTKLSHLTVSGKSVVNAVINQMAGIYLSDHTFPAGSRSGLVSDGIGWFVI